MRYLEYKKSRGGGGGKKSKYFATRPRRNYAVKNPKPSEVRNECNF